jgi:hypothetical protein
MTCVKLNKSEIDNLISQNRKLVDEVDLLRSTLAVKEREVAEIGVILKATEDAAALDGIDKLALKADRIMANNAVRAWLSYRDHVKISSHCIPCRAGSMCIELTSLEKNAVSELPKVVCPDCDSRDKEILMLRDAVSEYFKLLKHTGVCEQCNSTEGQMCWVSGDIRTSISLKMNRSSAQPYSYSLYKRLLESAGQFSVFGDGSAILYHGGRYKFIKVNLKEIPIGSCEHLSEGGTPGDAVENAMKYIASSSTHVVNVDNQE